jgi:uncharacterized membrane protein
VPGFLILSLFNIKNFKKGEKLYYTVCLSLFYLIFQGYIFNEIIPLFNIVQPLSKPVTFIGLDLAIIILSTALFKKNINSQVILKLDNINLFEIGMIFISILLPVLSVLGAISLNNGGTNTITMIFLFLIPSLVYINIKFGKKEYLSLLSIFSVSLSVLWMFSLRGWHIFASGDIGQEFYVFQLTKNNGLWSISSFRDAYNACLSLTILPTYLSQFLKISDEYIFKLVYPAIFSFSSIGIYILNNKIFNKRISYLATFFFISTPFYYTEMSIIMRQEIALLFFIMLLLAIFSNKEDKNGMHVLFFVAGVAMVVSHYSTSYIALILLILANLVLLIVGNVIKYKSRQNLNRDCKSGYLNDNKYYDTNIYSTIALLILALLWYSQTSLMSNNNIGSVFSNTILSLSKTFSTDSRAEGTSLLDQLHFRDTSENHETLLKKYYNAAMLSRQNDPEDFYKDSTFVNYHISEVVQDALPLHVSQVTYEIMHLLFEIIKKLSYLFILVGCFIIIYLERKRMNLFYLSLLLSCIVLLFIMSLLPYITYVYPFERLYQQLLIILSVPAIIGAAWVLFNKNILTRYLLVYTILIINFWYNTGFLPQIIGGFDNGLNLNNYGDQYNSAYTTRPEVYTIKWLKNNATSDSPIFTDQSSRRKILAFSGMSSGIIEGIVPPNIQVNSYVFANQSNFSLGNALVLFQGAYIYYKYPLDFLESNKNLIYNNQKTAIFK